MSQASAGWPLRFHLALLALLLLVPSIAFSGSLIYRYSALQRGEAERRVVQLAADLAGDVDREHERNIVLLRSLALSESLRAGDLEKFHGEARQALRGSDDAVIVLDNELRSLLNSGVAWGAPLSPYSAPNSAHLAIENLEPVVTGLFFGQTRQRQVINVIVPVAHDGKVDYVLVLSYGPERIRSLVQDQNIGGNWTSEISDASDVLIAGSQTQSLLEIVGKKLPEALWAKSHPPLAPHNVEGLHGRNLLRATAVTRRAGWLVSAAVDEQMLQSTARANWRDLAMWGVALLGIALVACYKYGLAIESPLRKMVDNLILPEAPPLQSRVSEIRDVSVRLSTAVRQMRESDERFKSFTEQIDQVIWFQEGPAGGLRYASPAYATIWGRPTEELNANPAAWMASVHRDDRGRIEKAYSDLVAGAAHSFDVEYRIVRPDGTERWIRDRGVLPTNHPTRSFSFGGIADDITQTKSYERKLERYRVLLDRARDIKLVMTAEGRILEANAAAVSAYGYAYEELVALNIADLRAVVTLGELSGQLEAVHSSKDGLLFETIHRRRDGSTFPVEISACATALEGERLILSVIRDITARRNSEASLALHVVRQEALLDLSNALIALGNDQARLGQIVFESISGVPAADVFILRRFEEGRGQLAVVFEYGLDAEGGSDDRALEIEWRPGTANSGGGIKQELGLRILDAERAAAGEGIHVLVCEPLLDGQERLAGSIAIGSRLRQSFSAEEMIHLQAVTSILALAWGRLTAEDTMRRNEARLRFAAQSAKLAYAVLDTSDGKAWLSENFSDVVGYEVPETRPSGLNIADISRLFLDRVVAEDRQQVEALPTSVFDAGGEIKLEIRGRNSDGSFRWLETTWRSGVRAEPGGRWAFATILDITKRKDDEDRVRHLLREVSHRSKNLLSVILSIARHSPRDAEPGKFVETLSQRIRGLAASQDLLVRSDWQGVDLSDLVRAQIALVRELRAVDVSIAGPNVLLTSSAAQSIGMALHELAVNVGEFDTLASPAARIAISWDVGLGESGGVFVLTWSATGPTKEKNHGPAGFGRMIVGEMMEAAVQGSVSISTKGANFTWRLEVDAMHVADRINSG